MKVNVVGRARRAGVALGVVLLMGVPMFNSWTSLAQSGRKSKEPGAPQKKTDAQKGADQNQAGSEEPLPPMQKNEPPLKLSTQVVNVDISVIDKKTHHLVQGLTKKNFTIYEDGVKQEVTNFATGDGPVTAVLLVDNGFQNRYLSNYFQPSFAQEIFMSAAGFMQTFVKKGDYIALVTYSMRPKVIQDFTDDRQRLYEALMEAYRDLINFHESCMFDALAFTLVGGKAYQLYAEDAGLNEYQGLNEVDGRTAVILISTGFDTFSKLTYDKTMKIVEGAGVPVFTIGVGNLFFKSSGDQLPPEVRLTFLQAQNELGTFAKLSGGTYFPMTFSGEIPSIMQSIGALLRNEYSLGYVPTNSRAEGKERKIKVDVDIDGDGKPDNDKVELHYRERYVEPGGHPKKK